MEYSPIAPNTRVPYMRPLRSRSVQRANRAILNQENVVRQISSIARSSKKNLWRRAESSGIGAIRTSNAAARLKPNFSDLKRWRNVRESLRRSATKQAQRTQGQLFDYMMLGSPTHQAMINIEERKARKASNLRREDASRSTQRKWRNLKLQNLPDENEKLYNDALNEATRAITDVSNSPTNVKKVNAAIDSANRVYSEAQTLMKLDRSASALLRLKWAKTLWEETQAASRALNKKEAWSYILKYIRGVK